MPFKPGQSGNPGGRPADGAVKRLARDHSPEAVEKLIQWMRCDNPKASILACNSILDRAYGKPKQAIVGGDEDDAPIKIEQIKRVLIRAQSEHPDG